MKNKEDIDVVKGDLEKYGKLYALSTSEGGQILLKNLAEDIMSAIDILGKQRDMDEIRLRHWCLIITTKLAMWRSLTNSKENVLGAQEELAKLMA